MCTGKSKKDEGFHCLLSSPSHYQFLTPDLGKCQGSAFSLHSALHLHCKHQTWAKKCQVTRAAQQNHSMNPSFTAMTFSRAVGSQYPPAQPLHRPARKKQPGKGVIQIRSLFIQFMLQFMQIKAFLSGEEGTNGVYDLLPRFFGAVLKTQSSAPPPPAALLEEFLPPSFAVIPFGESGLSEGSQTRRNT